MSLFFFGLAWACFGYAAGIVHCGWRTFESFNEGYEAGRKEVMAQWIEDAWDAELGADPEELPRDRAEISKGAFEL